MTPDTAAWRTLADAALQPLMPHMDFRQQVALDRARKDAARALCDAADEVERLREAVERLIHHEASLLATGARYYSERDAARAEVQAFTYWRDSMAAILPDEYREEGAAVEVSIEDAYGDGIAALAASTAHAALVADLRALVGGDELVSQRAVNPDEYTRRTGDRVPSYLAFYQGAADLAAVIRALLDRHAPTLTTTED